MKERLLNTDRIQRLRDELASATGRHRADLELLLTPASGTTEDRAKASLRCAQHRRRGERAAQEGLWRKRRRAFGKLNEGIILYNLIIVLGEYELEPAPACWEDAVAWIDRHPGRNHVAFESTRDTAPLLRRLLEELGAPTEDGSENYDMGGECPSLRCAHAWVHFGEESA